MWSLSWAAIFLYIVSQVVGNSQVLNGNGKCERLVHASFNPEQKRELCLNFSQFGNGPALCSSLARDKLHFSQQEAIMVCKKSFSTAPVVCIEALPLVHRKKIGIQLCSNTETHLRGICAANLLSSKNKIQKLAMNKIKEDDILTFCSHISDSLAPLYCLESALETKMLNIKQALELCPSAMSEFNETSACLHGMKPHSLGKLPNVEFAKFCIVALPEAYGDAISHNINSDESYLVNCFNAASKLKHSSGSSLSSNQKLQLCENSSPKEKGLGPTQCFQYLMVNSKDFKTSSDDAIEVCKGASSDGPARCWLEGRSIDSSVRKELCMNAPNAGPAACFRRAQSLFSKSQDILLMLCSGVDSDAPGECVTRAPLYMSPLEKYHLCDKAPISRSDEPLACIHAVESASRLFVGSPKIFALGEFASGRKLPQEEASRELLINMCSFSNSHAPLASAECLKSAPKSLTHDDAVRLCTNVTSAQIISHISLCLHLLPAEWTSEEASVLCQHSQQRKHSEMIVQCAIETKTLLHSYHVNDWSRLQMAEICQKEQIDRRVFRCLEASLLSYRQSSHLYSTAAIWNFANVLKVCTHYVSSNIDLEDKKLTIGDPNFAFQVESGQCLSELVRLGNQYQFETNFATTLCSLSHSKARLQCLFQLNRRELSIADLNAHCLKVTPIPHTVQVKRLFSLYNEPFVMANRRFSLWLDVLDQWGLPYREWRDDSSSATSSNSSSQQDGKDYHHKQQHHHQNQMDLNQVLYVSINDNNPQGAVLWGHRHNHTSSDGWISFDFLMISQPGVVELKVYRLVEGEKKQLGLFRLEVRENPEEKSSHHCLQVFHSQQCSSQGSQIDHEAEFPKVRGWLSSSWMHLMLSCQDMMTSWGVFSQTLGNGDSWIEYKLGIDSIWTGVGFPDEDMPHEDRLELSPKKEEAYFDARRRIHMGDFDRIQQSTDISMDSANEGRKLKKLRKTAAKELKRAYYRKSLQWHPDRWAGLPRYLPVVQSVFELVHDSYEFLLDELEEA